MRLNALILAAGLCATPFFAMAEPTTQVSQANASIDAIPYQDGATFALPQANKSGGPALADALAARHTSRAFKEGVISQQLLSDMLWATAGATRGDKLTIPTARNLQNFHIYVLLKQGAYRYDAKTNSLVAQKAGNFLKDAGPQPFVGTGGVEIVFVSDTSVHPKQEDPTHPNTAWITYDGMHAGSASQNLYLFAAAHGMGTVVRGMVDRDALKAKLGLPENYAIIAAQSVGLE